MTPVTDDMFQVADEAVLLTDQGDLLLLVTRHEHADKVIVERFRLGSRVPVAALVKLLDSLGLLHQETPETAPAAATEHTCPECGKTAKTAHGIDVHRWKKHGQGKHVPVVRDGDKEALPEAGICQLCNKPWKFHERCVRCGVGIGLGHDQAEPIMVKGEPFCRDCVRADRLQARVEVAA